MIRIVQNICVLHLSAATRPPVIRPSFKSAEAGGHLASVIHLSPKSDKVHFNLISDLCQPYINRFFLITTVRTLKNLHFLLRILHSQSIYKPLNVFANSPLSKANGIAVALFQKNIIKHTETDKFCCPGFHLPQAVFTLTSGIYRCFSRSISCQIVNYAYFFSG